MHDKVIDMHVLSLTAFPEFYSGKGKDNELFFLLLCTSRKHLNMVNSFCFKTREYLKNLCTNKSLVTVAGRSKILPAMLRFPLPIWRVARVGHSLSLNETVCNINCIRNEECELSLLFGCGWCLLLLLS